MAAVKQERGSESVADQSSTENPAQIKIADILSPGRVVIDMHVSSKKRLLEEVAALLVRDTPNLDQETVFHALFDRERLGSTAVGDGVAIPHGRVSDLAKPIGAFATLKRPLDYDAPDNEPIQLVFGLLVPADANDTHVQLLRELAKKFSDELCRDALSTLNSPDDACRILGEQ